MARLLSNRLNSLYSHVLEKNADIIFGVCIAKYQSSLGFYVFYVIFCNHSFILCFIVRVRTIVSLLYLSDIM